MFYKGLRSPRRFDLLLGRSITPDKCLVSVKVRLRAISTLDRHMISNHHYFHHYKLHIRHYMHVNIALEVLSYPHKSTYPNLSIHKYNHLHFIQLCKRHLALDSRTDSHYNHIGTMSTQKDMPRMVLNRRDRSYIMYHLRYSFSLMYSHLFTISRYTSQVLFQLDLSYRRVVPNNWLN